MPKEIIKYMKVKESYTFNLERVVLVDDVLTSGNTLKTCAELLTKAGITKIKLLTISKSSNFKRI